MNEKASPSLSEEALLELVVQVLEDLKALDIRVLDVRGKTSITDYFVIASGRSDRHVTSIAEAVAFKAKLAGEPPLGTEGVQQGEWALVDLNGVVVHVMQPRVRDFYQLEKLWSVDAEQAERLLAERGGSGEGTS